VVFETSTPEDLQVQTLSFLQEAKEIATKATANNVIFFINF
jgi:hypothetical protein